MKFKDTAMQLKNLKRYDRLDIKIKTKKNCVVFKNEYQTV